MSSSSGSCCGSGSIDGKTTASPVPVRRSRPAHYAVNPLPTAATMGWTRTSSTTRAAAWPGRWTWPTIRPSAPHTERLPQHSVIDQGADFVGAVAQQLGQDVVIVLAVIRRGAADPARCGGQQVPGPFDRGCSVPGIGQLNQVSAVGQLRVETEVPA